MRAPQAFLVALAMLGGVTANATVTFDWATVGNPDNPPDRLYTFNNLENLRFGSVGYTYRISKYEVTNDQYTEFLNAVDPTGANPNLGGADPFLYNSSMSSDPNGGINLNSGAANGSKYQLKSGRDNNPVIYVSFFDAMRFTNWLENGQGTGSTETGVYMIGNGLNETRNPSATYFIPSEDEWYKAAYHQPAAQGGDVDDYWLYPTSTDAVPFSDQPPGSDAPTQSNTANFWKDDGVANGYDDGYAVTGSTIGSDTQNYLTDVGAYTASLSPYGTFDQGGNVWEWNEAVIASLARGQRGGGFDGGFLIKLAAFLRSSGGPANVDTYIGFRVASIAEPTLDCDFSGDGLCDATDLDLMQSLGPIAPGVPATGNEEFDLDGDGMIDLLDRDLWLAAAATENGLGSPYKLGDANLDGVVDVSDFNLWNTNKFTTNLLWSAGEFGGDGSVDVSDFNQWNVNKFTSSGGAAAVPEPTSRVLWLFAMLLLGAAGKRRWG